MYSRSVNMSEWQIVLPEKSFTGKVTIRQARDEDCVDIYVVKFHRSAEQGDALINRVAELAALDNLTTEEKQLIATTRVAVSANCDIVGYVQSSEKDGYTLIEDIAVLPSYVGKRLYVKLLQAVHSRGKLITNCDDSAGAGSAGSVLKQQLQSDGITLIPVCKDGQPR